MATEYRLILAAEPPVEQVAERAFPRQEERPAGTPPLLTADLYQRYGFELAVRGARNGYFDAESDDGLWEWEPESYVALTFRMEKEADSDRALVHMLTVVGRVLDTGPEDAALILNGNWLLLTRFGGLPVKHRRAVWWENYAEVNDIIRG
ncbi:hypothetical protein J2S43_008117 [Catenuloplanes nepalensis]|uniref:Uncharacterized protein n=1 Tax=Catenuloplanes nepalensis TaxID=587533 RepID=A0ABT9N7W6_9ACTN|nr:SitI3 family protein [Catenuloplanes nepalensis]MDP9799605.1 hypothetical protein [Catenuloplanes nepalensis]